MEESIKLFSGDIDKIVYAYHHDPFHILGIRKVKEGGVVVRFFTPELKEAYVIDTSTGEEHKMELIHDLGFYQKHFPDKSDIFDYKIKKVYNNGYEETIIDPYKFMPVLTEYDRHLVSKGDHHRTYDKFGAHIIEKDGVIGVHFAVWAPNARRVSVVGDFNHWDGRVHQMRVLGSSGIWEIFIPEIKNGNKYKFEIKTKADEILMKTDPHGFYSELRPKTASVVYDINGFEWSDDEWMKNRAEGDVREKPISMYEVHLGSWMRVPEEGDRYLTYKEMAPKLAEYVKEMGYTHIELMPVSEYPFDGSWGYQVVGFFAPTSRFGEPKDFMYFVDYMHKNGIGVILDWVPAHFPKDSHGLSYFDGTPLYEHPDPRKGEHADWGTLIFDYGRYEVSNFLISSGLFWFDKYHIDGVRVDAVASMLYLNYGRKDGEWVANKYGGNENIEAVEFIKKFNALAHKYHRGIMTIAEESTAWEGVTLPPFVGGLGFNFKWNMGWMNDTLEYMKLDPIHRKYHHDKITFGMVYAFSENYLLVLSHDEVVHGKRSMVDKMPGDEWQKFANLRAYYGFQFTHPGKKLLFMGGEIGMWNEWWEARSIDWHLLQNGFNYGLQRFVKDLNHIYKSEKSLYEYDHHDSTFQWMEHNDINNNIFVYIRRAKDPSDYLIIVLNFSPVPRDNYRIYAPENRFYKEILNSNAGIYGGSNTGNLGGVQAEDYSWREHQYSLNLFIPPLSVLILKPSDES